MGIQLNTPVEHIPGILPLKADLLKKNLGVFFVKDLISHYPFRYIDKSKIYQIREVTEQVAFIQLYGKIEDISTTSYDEDGNVEISIDSEEIDGQKSWGRRTIKHLVGMTVSYIVSGKREQGYKGFNHTILKSENENN